MSQRVRSRLTSSVLATVLVLGGCGGEDAARESTGADTTDLGAGTTAESSSGCADVIDATATPAGDDWVIAATIASADTGDDKYADVWEARTGDGTVVVERVLAHPHVEEQPFTRSASPVAIPADVEELTVVAHDSVSGWCGDAFTLDLRQP